MRAFRTIRSLPQRGYGAKPRVGVRLRAAGHLWRAHDRNCRPPKRRPKDGAGQRTPNPPTCTDGCKCTATQCCCACGPPKPPSPTTAQSRGYPHGQASAENIRLCAHFRGNPALCPHHGLCVHLPQAGQGPARQHRKGYCGTSVDTAAPHFTIMTTQPVTGFLRMSFLSGTDRIGEPTGSGVLSTISSAPIRIALRHYILSLIVNLTKVYNSRKLRKQRHCVLCGRDKECLAGLGRCLEGFKVNIRRISGSWLCNDH